MPTRPLCIIVVVVATSLNLAVAAPSDRPEPVLPVSVSSANYATTPWDQVRRFVADPSQVNPLARNAEPIAQPQHFVFAPGELYESDVPYAELCRQLDTALAKKGYLNAADANGRIAAPDKIDLILRISSGGRRWRNPAVRTENLTWKEGLAHTDRTTRSLIGGQVAFDNRAGGNDYALAGAMAEQGKIGSATGGIMEASQGVAAASGYESSRDFFLLVIDAFGYRDLLEKKARAQRRWTTFIALPREEHNSFAAVLPTLLRVATPYFGETTRGLQVFTDARATVKLGDFQVIDSDVRSPLPAKK